MKREQRGKLAKMAKHLPTENRGTENQQSPASDETEEKEANSE